MKMLHEITQPHLHDEEFVPDQKLVNGYVEKSLQIYEKAASPASKAFYKKTAEQLIEDYSDKVKFYQPEDYFKNNPHSEYKQMVRTKLEAAKIFLTKIA